jgi:hypothetical protein
MNFAISVSAMNLFFLFGFLNKPNFRYWETKTLPAAAETIRQSGVLLAYHHSRLLARMFTVTHFPQVQRDTRIQQGGETSHTAKKLCCYTNCRGITSYPETDISWSARSVDLSACDFFFVGLL